MKEEDFEEFWKIWPRKTARRKAYSSFKTKLKMGHKKDDILNGARAFVSLCKSRGTDLAYYPYPATWLNQERWTDEDIRLFRVREVGGCAGSDSGGHQLASIPNCLVERIGRAVCEAYFGICTFDADTKTIKAPTPARKNTLLNRFQHKLDGWTIEVAQ